MKSFWLCALLAVAPAVAGADQSEQMAGMDHSAHMAAQQMPTEAGQAAFAAIHEIVGMLVADPQTDWSKVNIEALRQHLIDMDNVTMRADVAAEDVPGGARFRVSGQGGVVGAIRRMTLAHAAMMQGAGGWTYAARELPGGAELVVTAKDPADAVKIRALGYIGLMALGSHHQKHHLMIAKGENPHR